MPIAKVIAVGALAVVALLAIVHGMSGIVRKRIRVRFGYATDRRATAAGLAFVCYGIVLGGAAVALVLMG